MEFIARNRFRLDNGNEIQVTGHLAFDLFSPDGQLIGFFHIAIIFNRIRSFEIKPLGVSERYG